MPKPKEIVVINGVIYHLEYDVYVVTGYETPFTNTTVTIMGKIGKTPVRRIADEAFEGCNSIRRLEIPNTLGIIGNRAFKNCTNLKSVFFYSVLSEKLKPIDTVVLCEEAFSHCLNLRIVSSLTLLTLNYQCFEQCYSLEAVIADVQSLLFNMESCIFAECRTLRYLRIMAPKIDFDESTFRGCTQSIDLVFPMVPDSVNKDSLKSLQHMKFYFSPDWDYEDLSYSGYQVYPLEEAPI